jgi:tetratricopeptide (TPR) repeat protein
MSDMLSTAIEMHQAGRLASAAELYQKVLAQEHGNPDALHLLGVVRHQQGEHAQAIELICQAIALRPSVPAFHANLAEAYRAQREFTRAAGCCRIALRLWPDYPEAYCNLGLALQGLGRGDEAIEQFRRAVALRPSFASAYNGLGVALREAGNLDEALEAFQQAAEHEPKLATARSNLAQLLLDRGQPQQALMHAEEAVRLQPDLAAARNNLGNVLRALERLVEARAAYAEALRLDPDMAQAIYNMGLTLFREGKLGDALPWLKDAVELQPENAVWWADLADLRMEREEFPEAIIAYERDLALRPERAVTHNGLGWALQQEGRLDEAAGQFRTALELDPQSGWAQLNLGGVHEELGELTEAEAAFRAALAIQPRFAAAHTRLATLLRGKLPASDRAALEERLAASELNEEARSGLLFGLAHVLDAGGEYSRAAECLREANALACEQAKRRNRDYDPAAHEQFVDQILTQFDVAFFKRTSGGGSDSRRPVFIFGLPRSGTTLIEQVLSSHSRVHGAGELVLVRHSFERIPEIVERSGWPIENVQHLDGSHIRRLADQHLEWLQGFDGCKAERIVDKMPDNSMYAGFITAMFPNAILIHCRRDLRDIAVSCWMTNFRSIRWANDPDHIATRFAQHRRVMDHWRSVLPARLHEIDYEDTVTDLEGTARRLIAACGLAWEPACLDFHRTRRPVRTASITQVRQPIYTKSVARWKHYESFLADLFTLLPLTDE